MRIGDLARRSGASVRSLRYYEEQGLLHAVRTSTGQRTYTEDAVERVRMLRRLYTAGLTSTTIAALLPCVDTPSAATTRETVAVMRREHDPLGGEIADLLRTREQLATLIEGAAAHGARQELEDPAASAA